MRELDTQTAQLELLPKSSARLYLVLFYRSSRHKGSERSLCSRAIVAGFELVAVDLDHAPLLAERFQLPALPVLAAVYDGTILCLEDQNITDKTCLELAALAQTQQKSLLEVAL